MKEAHILRFISEDKEGDGDSVFWIPQGQRHTVGTTDFRRKHSSVGDTGFGFPVVYGFFSPGKKLSKYNQCWCVVFSHNSLAVQGTHSLNPHP